MGRQLAPLSRLLLPFRYLKEECHAQADLDCLNQASAYFGADRYPVLSGITYDLAEPVLNTTPGVLQQARILIDPGHGGIDPGTGEKFKLYEKDINLDLAFRLRELLESKGATIDLTRWSDQELSYLSPDLKAGRHRRDLWGRVFLSQAYDATILISLHVNSSSDENERGSIVFYARGSGDGKALAGAVQAQLQIAAL